MSVVLRYNALSKIWPCDELYFKTKQTSVPFEKKNSKTHTFSQVFKMQITVTTLRGDVFSLEVPEDLELENFKAFCEAESGISSQVNRRIFIGYYFEILRKKFQNSYIKWNKKRKISPSIFEK